MTTYRGKKRVVANGVATGYGFLRFKQEGIFDNFVSMANESVASSMGNTPRIGGSGKRGTASPSSGSRKKNYPGSNDADSNERLNLLVRMSDNFTLEGRKFGIDQLRNQINNEETSLLNHKQSLHPCALPG